MLREYMPLDTEFRAYYRTMPLRQARAEFAEFVSSLPERVAQLHRALGETGRGHIPLDYSFESVARLGEWLDAQVQTKARDPDTVAAVRSRVPSYVRVDSWELSAETITICNHVGAYVGECLVRQHDALVWDFVRAPKSDVYVHQPVVVGPPLPARKCGDPNGLRMNPIGVVLGIAMATVGGKRAVELLPTALANNRAILLGLYKP